MKKYIDINQVWKNGSYITILPKNNTEIVVSGTTVYTLPTACRAENPYRRLKETHNISFFYEDEQISIPFYCVPLIDFFAKDTNGYFGTLHGYTDLGQIHSPIYYIGIHREIRFAAENLSAFFENDDFLSLSEPRDSILLFNSPEEAEKELPFLFIK